MSNQTTKTRRFHLSPALVISCIALIFALAGSAVAAGVVGKNSVRSPQIVDGAVRTVDLRDNSVQTPKIAPDAVTGPKIAENAVDSTDIVENGVNASDLGAASVGTSEVQDQSLTSNDLGTDSVGSSELQAGAVRASELGPIVVVSSSTTIKGNDNASVGATCPAGTTVISGGNSAGFYQVHVAGSYRSGNGWHIDARSAANNDTTLTAFAYCLSGGSSN
jgi:hypothetical protein